MRTTALIAQHVQPPPTPTFQPQAEASRLFAAAALLLAAALVLTGGLIWREHARAEGQREAARAQQVAWRR